MHAIPSGNAATFGTIMASQAANRTSTERRNSRCVMADVHETASASRNGRRASLCRARSTVYRGRSWHR